MTTIKVEKVGYLRLEDELSNYRKTTVKLSVVYASNRNLLTLVPSKGNVTLSKSS